MCACVCADEDFAQAENAALVGTTAVVALVGTRMLYVANCGECLLPSQPDLRPLCGLQLLLLQ